MKARGETRKKDISTPNSPSAFAPATIENVVSNEPVELPSEVVREEMNQFGSTIWDLGDIQECSEAFSRLEDIPSRLYKGKSSKKET